MIEGGGEMASVRELKEGLLSSDRGTTEPQENDRVNYVRNLLASIGCRPGYLWLALGVFLQAGQMTLIGKVSNMLGVGQAVFIRSCFSVTLIFFVNWRRAQGYGWREIAIVTCFGVTDILMALGIGAANLFIWNGDVTAITLNVPLPSIVLAWLLFSESMDRIDIVLVLFNAGGLIFVSEPSFLFPAGKIDPEHHNAALGFLMAFLALFCAVSVTLCPRALSYREAEDPCLMASVAGMIGIIMSLGVSAASPQWTLPNGTEEWAVAIALGFVCVSAIYSYVKALESESVMTVSVTITLSILLVNVYDFTFDERKPEWPKLVGIALILGSTFALKLKGIFLRCYEARS